MKHAFKMVLAAAFGFAAGVVVPVGIAILERFAVWLVGGDAPLPFPVPLQNFLYVACVVSGVFSSLFAFVEVSMNEYMRQVREGKR